MIIRSFSTTLGTSVLKYLFMIQSWFSAQIKGCIYSMLLPMVSP